MPRMSRIRSPDRFVQADVKPYLQPMTSCQQPRKLKPINCSPQCILISFMNRPLYICLQRPYLHLLEVPVLGGRPDVIASACNFCRSCWALVLSACRQDRAPQGLWKFMRTSVGSVWIWISVALLKQNFSGCSSWNQESLHPPKQSTLRWQAGKSHFDTVPVHFVKNMLFQSILTPVQ